MNVVVKWEKMGPEFSYDVWRSKSITGPWVRCNGIRLTDDVIDHINGFHPVGSGAYGEVTADNEYTVTGLDRNTNYCFKVTCYDRYYRWWYSYSGPTDVGGGLGNLGKRPSPDGGNVASFQFCIV
jgi:hypothetical protein